MKISLFFSRHILRPSTTRQGNASELVLQLRKIANHHSVFPTPQKPIQIEIDLSQFGHLKLKDLRKTPEYQQQVADARQNAQKEFAKIEQQNAYRIRQSYTANGGFFSYAQQLANKSRANVIGVKGEYVSSLEGNKQQYILFRPQNKFLEILSNFGNYLLSK